MTSPAITIHAGEAWSFSNCEFHFFHNSKKVCFSNLSKEASQLHPYEYPNKDELNSGTERFAFLSNWILEILSRFDTIDCIWIEGYSYGSTGSRIFEIGENTGILKYRLFEKGIPFRVVPPTVVKKFYTGSGKADKQLLEEAFISETNLDLRTFLNQTKKQFNPSSDIIDSYAICKYGFFMNKIEK